MADFDYFYTFENFIGYTGDISVAPTLYFMNEAYYGRITTQHGHQQNVGRAAPKLLNGYKYDNCWVDRGEGDEWRLVEENTRFGKSHTSRNYLIKCEDAAMRARVKPMVLLLIGSYTDVKSKDDVRTAHEFVPL